MHQVLLLTSLLPPAPQGSLQEPLLGAGHGGYGQLSRGNGLLFSSMTCHPTLCHFKKGISMTTQWTGNEYKNMEKIFLAAMGGTDVDERVVHCIRALVDFIDLFRHVSFPIPLLILHLFTL